MSLRVAGALQGVSEPGPLWAGTKDEPPGRQTELPRGPAVASTRVSSGVGPDLAGARGLDVSGP